MQFIYTIYLLIYQYHINSETLVCNTHAMNFFQEPVQILINIAIK